MFLNPSILRTVAFVEDNESPKATVFFVRFPIEETASSYAHYAVTTKHSVHDVVSIKFNLRAGGTRSEAFSRHDWFESASTDIAALPLDALELESYELEYVEPGRFAYNKDYLRRPLSTGPVYLNTIDAKNPNDPFPLPYGTGDEVFSIGLFEGHPGQDRVQPAIRFGHIALKPSDGEKILAEVIPDKLTPVDAFLVEMSVWQGQSGSPLFIREFSADGKGRLFPQLEEPPPYLLGMIQGFYPGLRRSAEVIHLCSVEVSQ